MIDLISLMLVAVAGAAFFPEFFTPLVLLGLVLLGPAMILLLVVQFLAVVIGPRGKRMLWRLGFAEATWLGRKLLKRRRRLVESLIAHYRLDPVLESIARGEPVAPEMASDLRRDIHEVNRWPYRVLQRTLSKTFLRDSLVETRPSLSRRAEQLDEWLWRLEGICPSWGDKVSRAIGNLVFGRRMTTVEDRFKAVSKLTKHPLQADEKAFGFTETRLHQFACSMLYASELSFDVSALGHLPLWRKRLLVSARAVLYGQRLSYGVALLVNPSHYRLLGMIRGQVIAHEDWLERERERAAHSRIAATLAAAERERRGWTLQERPAEDVLAERSSPGILLARTWPIGVPAPGRSHLGGLPCLPRDMPWPRHGGNDTPLHFLARIDCRELPDLDGASPLPRDGDLLFFASVDDELLWRDGKTSRVIFVPPSARTEEERSLPPDMPRIGWPQGGSGRGRSDVAGGKYPKWPISAHPFSTCDMSEYADDGTQTLNAEQHRALVDAMKMQARRILPNQEFPRIESVVQTGHVLDPEKKNLLRDEKGEAIYRATYDPRPLGSGFPYCGAVLNAVVSDLRTNAEDDIAEEEWRLSRVARDQGERSEQLRAKYGAAIRLLRDFLEKVEALAARLGPVDDYSSAGDREREILADWITTLLADVRDVRAIGARVQNAIRMGLKHASRRAASDDRLSELMPEEAHALNAERLHPQLEHTFHVMLGARYQWTNPTGGSGVSLLKLDSDYGMGFMFSDCGVAEFWIDPEDLAQQRFDRAYALTAGG